VRLADLEAGIIRARADGDTVELKRLQTLWRSYPGQKIIRVGGPAPSWKVADGTARGQRGKRGGDVVDLQQGFFVSAAWWCVTVAATT
jgi:hypothetical protein